MSSPPDYDRGYRAGVTAGRRAAKMPTGDEHERSTLARWLRHRARMQEFAGFPVHAALLKAVAKEVARGDHLQWSERALTLSGE